MSNILSFAAAAQSRRSCQPVCDFYGRPYDSGPTDARPGTPEKVDVLTARAERGESLFHPFDAPLPEREYRIGFKDSHDNAVSLGAAEESYSLARTPGRRQKTSRFTGVHFDAGKGKWIAQVSWAGKQHYLGLFDTEFEASAAYRDAARELKGGDRRAA